MPARPASYPKRLEAAQNLVNTLFYPHARLIAEVAVNGIHNELPLSLRELMEMVPWDDN